MDPVALQISKRNPVDEPTIAEGGKIDRIFTLWHIPVANPPHIRLRFEQEFEHPHPLRRHLCRPRPGVQIQIAFTQRPDRGQGIENIT